MTVTIGASCDMSNDIMVREVMTKNVTIINGQDISVLKLTHYYIYVYAHYIAKKKAWL